MKSPHPLFVQPCRAVETSIQNLISEMSLEEKIQLLGGDPSTSQGGNTFGVPRLGIPSLKMADASVGVHWWTDRSTTYPASICLAASWDEELARRAGGALGKDAVARGIHILLGPGVNIYRSAVCGRNFEYFGEDPALAARTAIGFIEGLQARGVCATVKHFALNFQEYDRHHTSSDADERTMREVYFPAFEAAVCEAGCGAVMTAYNPVNGAHASENEFLIRQVLKEEWGFEGLVMSDWISTYSAVNAANAGLDLEMPEAKWMTPGHLLPAVRNGLVSVEKIDDKVRRLLRLMFCFGWLNREQQDATIPLEDEETAAIALEIAKRGSVLLKNERGVLPVVPSRGKKIALIGPHAAMTPIGGGGSAYNKPWRKISILEGMEKIHGAEAVLHSRGLPEDNSKTVYEASRFLTPDGSEGILVEYFNNLFWEGEPVAAFVERTIHSRWTEGLPEGVDPACFSVRWRGRLPLEGEVSVLLYQWFAAPFRVTLGGERIFDILDGADCKPQRVGRKFRAGEQPDVEVLYRGSGKGEGASFGWEISQGERLRSEAINLARRADVVLFCGGHSDLSEGEAFDREFSIPAEQEELLMDVAEANPNTVVVLSAGGNVDMRNWIDKVSGLLMIWYGGQEVGTAVAEIVSGLANPSGKLPATFEKTPEDRSSWSCYADQDGDKRVLLSDGVFCGYRHHDRNGVPPLFPFGFGLSYTSFELSQLALSASEEGEVRVDVSFQVKNIGDCAGHEVVQLYVSDLACSLPRPVKELKKFESIFLSPGESRVVHWSLHFRDFAFFHPDRGRWEVEAGEFLLSVGTSSRDLPLQGSASIRQDAFRVPGVGRS